ncbi:MAG: PEP-CTERM sorting domain-containing protein [Deltaproteobacteria bacterium]|nr:PEP-CTERM sorting domain-containing protein [Deltaproteobacteria bacterium]MBW2414108.1 PEP-CTERM sorting domain-containing protein [Deltaproteobacteria bacterium]
MISDRRSNPPDFVAGLLDAADAKFDFGNGLNDPSKNIDSGESSARLIVSYTLGDLSSAAGPVSFMIGAGPDFSVAGVIEEVPVPEPGLIALLGASLAGLGLFKRPRGRQ